MNEIEKNQPQQPDSPQEDVASAFDTENSTIFTSFDAPAPAKRKANGSLKLLITLVAVVLLVAGAIVAVTMLWNYDSGSGESTDNSSDIKLTASANVALDKMQNAPKDAFSNVAELTVTSKSGKLRLLPRELKKAQSEGESDTVIYKVDGYADNVPFDHTALSSIVNAALDVQAVRKLPDEWSEKDCGLDAPVLSVNVKMADGSSFSFDFGAVVPDGTGNYYLKCSLLGGIYIVKTDVFSAFDKRPTDLISKSVTTAAVSSGENDTYFNGDTLVRFDKIRLSGSQLEDPIEMKYDDSDGIMLYNRITAPVSCYGENTRISTLLSPMSVGLTADSAAVINPSAADLKKYGLDNPYYRAEYTVKGKTYALIFSAKGAVTDGVYSCMLEGVPVIYNVAATGAEFVEWDLGDLRSSAIYLRSVDSMKSLTFEYGKISDTYSLKSTVEPIEGTDDSEEYKLTVTLGGKEVDTDSFQNMYFKFVSLQPMSYLKRGEKPPVGESRLTVISENTDGTKDVLKFVKYNDRYYSFTVNGVGDTLVRYDELENIIHVFERFKAGEKIEM